MTNSRFAAIGGHQSNKPATVEWLTGRDTLDALGGALSFDLDPATPDIQPWPTARARYTRADNGLMKPWFGRVFLNPPYTANEIGRWLARMSEHGRGTALIFARTETDAFFRYVWEGATAALFVRGRMNFCKPDGSPARRPKGGIANAGAPSVLCAYGMHDADVLAFCGIEGQFVPLRFPRSVLGAAINPTWSEALIGWFEQNSGPVALDDLYRAFAEHPKTRGNQNWQAKIRQILQLGPFRRTGRGRWEAA